MGKPLLLSVVVLPRQPRLDQLLTVHPIAHVQQHQSVEVLALAGNLRGGVRDHLPTAIARRGALH